MAAITDNRCIFRIHHITMMNRSSITGFFYISLEDIVEFPSNFTLVHFRLGFPTIYSQTKIHTGRTANPEDWSLVPVQALP